jgi:nucleoside-specific outer membrane channel protein Tsx
MKSARSSWKAAARAAAFTAVTSAIATCAGHAAAADWSDTFAGYRYGTKFNEPANPLDIKKHIFSLTHVSGYKYGQNFFTSDVLMSDGNDPANGEAVGGAGAQEIYSVYRHQLFLSPVTGGSWKFGPVKETAVTAGFDFNSKDDAFSPRVRKFVLGPTLKLDVPGFLDVSLLYYKEKNHNGIVGAAVSFDPTYMLSLAWGIPLPAINAKFDGCLNHTGKKGKDGFGAETEPETLSQFYLMFDVGTLAGKKGTLYAGDGVEYWRNKYGSPAPVGADYTAGQLALEVHF